MVWRLVVFKAILIWIRFQLPLVADRLLWDIVIVPEPIVLNVLIGLFPGVVLRVVGISIVHVPVMRLFKGIRPLRHLVDDISIPINDRGLIEEKATVGVRVFIGYEREAIIVIIRDLLEMLKPRLSMLLKGPVVRVVVIKNWLMLHLCTTKGTEWPKTILMSSTVAMAGCTLSRRLLP